MHGTIEVHIVTTFRGLCDSGTWLAIVASWCYDSAVKAGSLAKAARAGSGVIPMVVVL